MSKHKTVIEINGKVYDASTGKMITDTNRSKVVDGFMKRKPTPSIAPSPQSETINETMKQNLRKPARKATTKHATQVHKKQERAHTLIRSIVKKPLDIANLKVAAAIPSAEPVVVTEVSPQSSVFGQLFTRVDEKKIDRAQSIPKSSLISRFGFGSSEPVVRSISAPEVDKKLAHMPVVPAPITLPEPFRGVKAVERVGKKSRSILSRGLANAQSHTEKHPKKITKRHKAAHKLGVSTRFVNVAGGSLLLLLIGSFVVYQNVPRLSMKVAAAKAGIVAKLPTKPSGFALSGPIEYAPGLVQVDFKSNSDDRSFNLKQQSTTWSEQSLKDSLVSKGVAYQTITQGDKTIYLYGESNAAWVSNGVLRTLEGNSSLNSSQILDLVKSL